MKVIIYSFERIFMMDSRQYSHWCWVEKKKVNDGSLNDDDGIKGESEWRLKLLEDEKVLKEGSRQDSYCWKWCLVGSMMIVLKKKTFVMWRFVWLNKKEMIISFKIHQTQKWYSSISHCELDWIELKKIHPISNEMHLLINGKNVLLFHS